MQQQQNPPNLAVPLILFVAIVAAIIDWRYKRRGGKRPTTRDRMLFTVAILVCAAFVAFFAFHGLGASTLGSVSGFLFVILFGLWEFARWMVRRKYPVPSRS